MNSLERDPLYRIAELERQLAALIQVGTVHSVDYPAARCRVLLLEEDDNGQPVVTGWLPWATPRAGTFARTWDPISIGEQVTILSPGGDPAQGVVLPAIFQTAHPAPDDAATVRRVVFEDGADIAYDTAAHKLTATIPGDVDVQATGTITLEAQGLVRLASPIIEIDGMIRHGQGTYGTGGSLRGDMTHADGDWTQTGGDITSDGVSLQHHTHPGDSGGTTGEPN